MAFNRPIPFPRRSRPGERRRRGRALEVGGYTLLVVVAAGVTAWDRGVLPNWPLESWLALLGIVLLAGALAAYLLVNHGWRFRRAMNQPSSLRHGEVIAVLSPRVIDGDTIEDTVSGVRYRLPNIDAPETGERARCIAERMLGERATALAYAIVSKARTVEACGIGKLDIHGRTLAYILVNGEDLGELMIQRGVARPWRGRRERWCATLWQWKLARM